LAIVQKGRHKLAFCGFALCTGWLSFTTIRKHGVEADGNCDGAAGETAICALAIDGGRTSRTGDIGVEGRARDRRTLMIEPKSVDRFPVRNCVQLIMSSNEKRVAPADVRRCFVLLDV
jgi:hypothetical protein